MAYCNGGAWRPLFPYVFSDQGQQAHARVEAMRQATGVDAPLRIAVGHVVTTVTEEARQEHADLILIGRGSVASPTPSVCGTIRPHARSTPERDRVA